mmetsp:Transcript_56938/g.101654  ORF Transcript_56938/g.101654 Transcript_56938/m.101654 type:complete len:333 (+) Transcript_56938:2964-3962(+)
MGLAGRSAGASAGAVPAPGWPSDEAGAPGGCSSGSREPDRRWAVGSGRGASGLGEGLGTGTGLLPHNPSGGGSSTCLLRASSWRVADAGRCGATPAAGSALGGRPTSCDSSRLGTPGPGALSGPDKLLAGRLVGLGCPPRPPATTSWGSCSPFASPRSTLSPFVTFRGSLRSSRSSAPYTTVRGSSGSSLLSLGGGRTSLRWGMAETDTPELPSDSRELCKSDRPGPALLASMSLDRPGSRGAKTVAGACTRGAAAGTGDAERERISAEPSKVLTALVRGARPSAVGPGAGPDCSKGEGGRDSRRSEGVEVGPWGAGGAATNGAPCKAWVGP